MWVFTVVSVLVLVLAAFQLSYPCRFLWPIPLAAFVLYPYAKRVTWFCHYALGLTLGSGAGGGVARSQRQPFG